MLLANKQIFFGELTQKLHNRTIKDPPPYRRDVKILLANLLSWINLFAKDFIEIERPNYSQIIKIKNKHYFFRMRIILIPGFSTLYFFMIYINEVFDRSESFNYAS